MRVLLLTLTAVIVCVAPLTAPADWDENYPWTKWVQMPDPFGWDVKVTPPKILADDFLCMEPVPITDIHFWGSWKGGIVGQITRVHLSIHNDLTGADPSQPAEAISQCVYGFRIATAALPAGLSEIGQKEDLMAGQFGVSGACLGEHLFNQGERRRQVGR